MSEHERLRKALMERDITRKRLKKARGALYRIVRMKPGDEPLPAFIKRLQRIAKAACGTPKKRKTKPALPGQIDLEEWLNAGRD